MENRKKVQLVQRSLKNRIQKNEEYDVREFIDNVFDKMTWYEKIFNTRNAMFIIIQDMIDEDN